MRHSPLFRPSVFTFLLAYSIAACSPGARPPDASHLGAALEAEPIELPPLPPGLQYPEPSGDPVVPSPKGALGYLPGSHAVGALGDFQYSIPIDVPAGRAGMQPSLSLQYSSDSGDGMMGVGWSLVGAGSRVDRCGSTFATEGQVDGVDFDADDRWCLDGMKLVEVGQHAGKKELRTEKNIAARILFDTQKFEVWSKDHRIRTYSPALAERVVADPYGVHSLGDAAESYRLTSERDRSGNTIEYVYEDIKGQYQTESLLKSIFYTSNGQHKARREVRFVYVPRSAPVEAWRAGVRRVYTQKLHRLEMYAPDADNQVSLAWSYELGYRKSSGTYRDLLTSVEKCGALGGCAWRRTFSWKDLPISFKESTTPSDFPASPTTLHVFDVDSDGKDDLLYEYGTGAYKGQDPDLVSFVYVRLTTSSGNVVQPISKKIDVIDDPLDAPFRDQLLGGGRPMDLDGDGRMTFSAYKHKTTPPEYRSFSWSSADERFIGSPSTYPATSTDFVDLDGDGRMDKVTTEETTPGSNVFWRMVRLNLGGGAFGSPWNTQLNSLCMPRATDMDADGRLELIVGMNGACEEHDWVSLRQSDDGTFEWGPGMPGRRDGRFLVLADMNSDGLPDVLDLMAQGAEIRWNTGNGLAPWEAFGDANLQAVLSLAPPAYRTTRHGDFDGDGRLDLLISSHAAGAGATHETSLLLARGGGTFHRLTLANEAGTMRIGDFDGDGRPDVLRVLYEGELLDYGRPFRVYLNQPPQDVIHEVKDQVSAPSPRVSVTYGKSVFTDPGAACSYPHTCSRKPKQVVASVVGSESPAQREYRFEDLVTDRRGRGTLGFRRRVEWISARPMQVTTEYDLETLDGTVYPGAAGFPAKVTTVVPILSGGAQPSVAAARVTEVVTSSAVHPTDNGLAFFVAPEASVTTEWEENVSINWSASAFPHISGVNGANQPGSTLVRTTTSVTEYDDYGNVTASTVATAGGDVRETVRTYEYRVDPWLIDLVSTEDVKVTNPASSDPPPAPRKTFTTWDVLGRLETVQAEPNGDDDSRETVTYTYDSDGNVRKVTRTAPNVLPSRVARFEYADPSGEHIFVSQVWDGNLWLSRWMYRHPAFGTALVVMDDYGRKGEVVIDDLGRPVSAHTDGGENFTVSYKAFHDAANKVVGVRTNTSSNTGAASYEVRDVLGRAIIQGSKTFDGTFAQVETELDALGRVVSVTLPHPPGSPAVQTTYTHDSLDRLLSTLQPDGKQVTKSYLVTPSYSEETTLDAMLHKTVLRHDQEGRVFLSRSFKDSVTAVDTHFVFGHFGKLREVKTPNPYGGGTVGTTIEYDARGRRKRLVESSAGETRFFYNGFGELRRVEDDLGEVTVMTRDFGGRLARVDVTDAQSQPIGSREYTYGAKGKLESASSSPDGVSVFFGYDSFGRQKLREWTIDGKKLSTTFGFDAFGRVETVDYPGDHPFATRYEYNPSGYAHFIYRDLQGQQDELLLEIVSRDIEGKLLSARYGNQMLASHEYDPLSGALLQTTATLGKPVYDVEYFYDDDGKLKQRIDHVADRMERFFYDELERLTDVALSHKEPRAWHYEYDDLGNRVEERVNGSVKDVLAYTFPGKPYQLATNLSGQRSYSYDGRGRLRTVLDVPTQTTRALEYTFFDLPRRIVDPSGETTFAYGPFGERVRKTTKSGGVVVADTLFVDDLYERRGSEEVFHVSGAGSVVWDGAKEKPRFILRDRLGSVGLVTDKSGVVERPFYGAWGDRQNEFGTQWQPPQPLPDVREGFTGHRHDFELELVDMRGRIYDPALGRFLSPDPHVTAPLFGQNYNRYTYVLNSPLNFTDPTGYDISDTWTFCDINRTSIYCHEGVPAGGGGGGASPPQSYNSGAMNWGLYFSGAHEAASDADTRAAASTGEGLGGGGGRSQGPIGGTDGFQGTSPSNAAGSPQAGEPSKDQRHHGVRIDEITLFDELARAAGSDPSDDYPAIYNPWQDAWYNDHPLTLWVIKVSLNIFWERVVFKLQQDMHEREQTLGLLDVLSSNPKFRKKLAEARGRREDEHEFVKKWLLGEYSGDADP